MYKTTMTIGFESLVRDRVLASSPENDFFVLGILGWNEASNLSLSRDNHSATRPSIYSLRPFRDTFLRGTCLQSPRTGGRGFAHTALSVFAYKGRHLGCSRWIRTTSPGHEPGMLPLHHHCDIFRAHYFLLSSQSSNKVNLL